MILCVKQLSEIRVFFTARIFSFGNLCLCHKNLYAERCDMEFHRNGIKWYRNFIEGEIRFYRKSVGNRKKKTLAFQSGSMAFLFLVGHFVSWTPSARNVKAFR